ncbi:MAG TPA: hypothetical protein VKP30_33010, partial [Polyangiaceae bacterium]|nr:hypothetical protein [Polyangiaceae bacterium]
ANVARPKATVTSRTDAGAPHPANVTRTKATVNTRTDAKLPHPAATSTSRTNTKSAGARKSKPPHPATVTASSKPKKTGKGDAKSPHPANRETPSRLSRSSTDRRASSSETRQAKPTEIGHYEYVERILQLEGGGDGRALAQQLSWLNSADLRTIAERFTNSTSWRAAGQVKWLRGEDVEAGTRRVTQVCIQRAAGGFTTKFEIVELPVDAVLAPDWQATDRCVKGKVLDFRVRSAL